MKKTITITIKKENWKALSQLELDKDLKTHDEAIEFLINKNTKVTHSREKTNG